MENMRAQFVGKLFAAHEKLVAAGSLPAVEPWLPARRHQPSALPAALENY
jgi:hypothetical protein